MRAVALLLLLTLPAIGQVTSNPAHVAAQDIPTNAEITGLLDRASEYVEAYRKAFGAAKPALDRSTASGFYEKAIEDSSQAAGCIGAIQKNGPTAYALVALIVMLDDMSLNAAKATATMTVISGPQHETLVVIVNLAQAGKNCNDISELLLHPTLRMISFEENTLHTVFDRLGK